MNIEVRPSRAGTLQQLPGYRVGHGRERGNKSIMVYRICLIAILISGLYPDFPRPASDLPWPLAGFLCQACVIGAH
jgi:hypothetical protein